MPTLPPVRTLAASLLALLLAACDPEAEPLACEPDLTSAAELVPLVDASAWTPSDLELDPLAAHQPELVICPSSAWDSEAGAVEVRTGECNYWSVEQPLLDAIEVGDPLSVQVWWQSLISTSPATGHIALLIDGALVWEVEVAIPGASEAREIELPSPIAAAAGSTVTLHLHNHGANSWTFAGLARLDPADTNPETDGCE